MCQAEGAAFTELRPPLRINTLRLSQNGRHFPDDILKCICLNENVWISLNISLKLVPYVRINNVSALVKIMAWRRPGDKPLSEPMMVRSLTHICVTRPQWVNPWNLFLGNIKIYLHFPPFLCTEMATLVEIIPRGKQRFCLSWITNTTGIDVTKGTCSHGTDSRIMRHCFLS